MCNTYSKMNYITSFGFSEKWRRQFVNEIDLKGRKIIVDLMTGMGECWKYIDEKSDVDASIIALDFSAEMIKQAKENKKKYTSRSIQVLNENVFSNSLSTNSVDTVVSGFGLKTFNKTQIENLAKEMKRIMKCGANFSLIDVSVPSNKMLKGLYLFYLKKIIPLLGKMFLGNIETYKMLGIYTVDYQNSIEAKQIFEKNGFEVHYVEYFFGCASGIKGIKN